MTKMNIEQNLEALEKLQAVLSELCKNPLNIAILYVLYGARYEFENSWVSEKCIFHKIHENFGKTFSQNDIKRQLEMLISTDYNFVGRAYTLGTHWYYISSCSQDLGEGLNKIFGFLIEEK